MSNFVGMKQRGLRIGKKEKKAVELLEVGLAS